MALVGRRTAKMEEDGNTNQRGGLGASSVTTAGQGSGNKVFQSNVLVRTRFNMVHVPARHQASSIRHVGSAITC